MIAWANENEINEEEKSINVIIMKNFEQLLCFVLTEPTQTFCECVKAI